MAADTELWRALGRVEEGQRSLEAGQRRLDEGLRETNKRIDRLTLIILGATGAIITTVIATRVLGG